MSFSSIYPTLLSGLMLAGVAVGGPVQVTPDASLEAGHFLVELDFDSPLMQEVEVNGRQFTQFELPGEGQVNRPGAPDLPAVSRLFEMPDRSDIQLRFLGGESYLLENVDVWPNQERVAQESENPLPWIEEVELYSQDAFWPSNTWELGDPALMRNTRIAKGSFFPVQVNPVQGTVRVWTRMEFELSFDGENTINQREFEIDSGYSPLSRQVREQVLPLPGADGEIRDTWFDEGDHPGKYIVIANTTAQSSSYFQELMDWKRQKGHELVILSQNDVSFTSSAIRSRISSEYSGPGSVDYVLLVGDTDGTYAVPTGGGNYDHYYAMIEGGDILGDVAVGRLSVDTASQLAAVCNKIVTYESDPYMGDTGWLRSAGFTVGSSVCGMSMKTLSRGIAAELVTRRGYTNIDTAFCAGSSHVINWFNSGITYYNYRGWVGMEGLSQTEVQNLQQGPRTPVATIFTCGTGDFSSGDDYTERFLMAGNASTPGGAVASMGFATLSTHTRYNNVLCGGYYSALLEHDVPEVGACLLQGKYELYMTLPSSEQYQAENFANWGNLMGDPGTVQWAGVPAALNASMPSTLSAGTDHVELTVTSGGAPVEGIHVCAWQDQGVSELQVVGLTDAAGHVILPLDGLLTGTLYVTASHQLYQPLQFTSTVSQQTADVEVNDWNMALGGLLPGISGQDLDFTLENTGSGSLGNISINPVLDAAYGSVNSPGLDLFSLGAGSQHTFAGLEISPVGDLSDGELVPLILEVSSSQGSFNRLVHVPVVSPLLSQTSFSYSTGILHPGETDSANITVRNDGSQNGQGVTVSLISDQPDLYTVNTASASLGNLNSGATTSTSFSVTASSMANPGQPINLTLQWTSHSGNILGSVGWQTSIGTQVVTDPTGPDAYGYWAYENVDSSYPFAPTYDWYAISAPEGGPGTEVLIEDTAEDDDEGAWVSLPFTFTYYGVSYDEMMVCSNGFVSFAEDGFGEWDFRNHVFPSAMGPDAMIAPMWDDHMTTGTNRGIWHWYDAANHSFVITWYNLDANASGGPNSFQLVLYDPSIHVTETGDGPFLFQYHTFNDTQSNGTDFNYCSIGFKDHTSLQGLTLLHWTTEASTIHTVSAGRAIYITTPPGEFEDTLPPVISFSTPDTPFAMADVNIALTISDFSGLDASAFFWRQNGGSWTEGTLTSNGGSSYSITLPGLPGNTVVEYYATATDASENANSAQSETQSYTVSPATMVFSEGFNGSSSFTHVAGGGLTDEWHLESGRSWEGSHSWKFGGNGTTDYDNNSGGVLSSPEIALPDGATDILVGFRSWIEAETSGSYPDSCYDGGMVEWNLDGAGWEQVAPSGDYTHALREGSTLTNWFGYPRLLLSGTDGWGLKELAVPNGTETVSVRFSFGTDQGATREGWYLDDFRLTAVVPEQGLDPVVIQDVIAGSGFLQLVWNSVPGATMYKVYESDEPYGTEWTLLSTVVGDTQLVFMPAGTRKYYFVTAAN